MGSVLGRNELGELVPWRIDCFALPPALWARARDVQSD